MKKITAVMKIDGQLTEKDFFAESLIEVKKLDGFVGVVSSENVSHPSPEVLQRVLLSMSVSLVDFYKACTVCQSEIDAEENRLCEAGDEKALARRAATEKRKVEAEAKRVEREAEKEKQARREAKKNKNT